MSADNERGSGRTTRQIMSMPESGGVYVVHTAPMVMHTRRLMSDHRGDEFQRRCYVVRVGDMGDVDHLRGLRLPIYIDHAWSEWATTYDAVERLELFDYLMHQQRFHERCASEGIKENGGTCERR